MNFFKNIIILFTLITFFSCAPTTIEKKRPVEKVLDKIEDVQIVEDKFVEVEQQRLN